MPLPKPPKFSSQRQMLMSVPYVLCVGSYTYVFCGSIFFLPVSSLFISSVTNWCLLEGHIYCHFPIFILVFPANCLKAAYYEKADKENFLQVLISIVLFPPAEFILIVTFYNISIYTQANVNIYIYIILVLTQKIAYRNRLLWTPPPFFLHLHSLKVFHYQYIESYLHLKSYYL